MSAKKPFAVFVIPDSGDARLKAGFTAAVYAQASGEAEALLLLRTDAAVQSVELVVVEHSTAVAGLHKLIRRVQP